MARTANVLLDFGGTSRVLVTVRDDGVWEAAGDPHGVLIENNGKWSLVASGAGGTDLNGSTELLVTLLEWRLSQAAKGQKGAAIREDEHGVFEVMLVV